MSDRKITLCLGCMRQKDETVEVCPHCGYTYKAEPQGSVLLPKTILNERYIIGRSILKDSDGISYIGFDISIESRVEIKEFFPDVLCERAADGSVLPKTGKEVLFKTMKSEFADLQAQLIRLKTLNNIPRVFDIFESNGTVYAVSEKKELIKFSDYLAFSNEKLTWDKVKEMFFPLFSTIATVNDAGIIHRKISPETIYVDKYSNLHIYGFCTESVAEQDFETGYAAPEMYIQNAETGFFSDVYSLGAVIYRAMSGITPTDANKRLQGEELAALFMVEPSVEPKVSDIVARTMAIDSLERIRSVRGLIEIINAALDNKGSEKKPVSVSRKKGKPLHLILIALFSIIFLGLIIGIAILLFNPQKAPDVPGGSGGNGNLSSSSDSSSEDSSQSEGGTKYAVPGFVGTAYDDIGELYFERFTIEVTYEYNDEYGEGLVVSQTPAEDESLEQSGVIKVVVSKGPEFLEIPSYEGVDIDTYKQMLIDLGYTEDKIKTYEYTGPEGENGEVVEVFLEDRADKIDVKVYQEIHVMFKPKPEAGQE